MSNCTKKRTLPINEYSYQYWESLEQSNQLESFVAFTRSIEEAIFILFIKSVVPRDTSRWVLKEYLQASGENYEKFAANALRWVLKKAEIVFILRHGDYEWMNSEEWESALMCVDLIEDSSQLHAILIALACSLHSYITLIILFFSVLHIHSSLSHSLFTIIPLTLIHLNFFVFSSYRRVHKCYVWVDNVTWMGINNENKRN